MHPLFIANREIMVHKIVTRQISYQATTMALHSAGHQQLHVRRTTTQSPVVYNQASYHPHEGGIY